MGHYYDIGGRGTGFDYSQDGNWTNDDLFKLYGNGDAYAGRQTFIEKRPYLNTGKYPEDDKTSNKHNPRWDSASGQVYSWDQKADHGKGAWGQSGVIKPGHPKPGDPKFNPDTDVDWFGPPGSKHYDAERYGAANYGDDFYTVPSDPQKKGVPKNQGVPVPQKQGDEIVPILSPHFTNRI